MNSHEISCIMKEKKIYNYYRGNLYIVRMKIILMNTKNSIYATVCKLETYREKREKKKNKTANTTAKIIIKYFSLLAACARINLMVALPRCLPHACAYNHRNCTLGKLDATQ